MAATRVALHRVGRIMLVLGDTFVQCPTDRMSEMRSLGIVFKEVGEKQYPGAKPFKLYAIEEPKPIMLPKTAPKRLSPVQRPCLRSVWPLSEASAGAARISRRAVCDQ